MLRWLVTVFVSVMMLSACWPWLARIGVGRLPGDVRLRVFGRELMFPFASSVVLTIVAGMLARFL
jgi:hypothetical protein